MVHLKFERVSCKTNPIFGTGKPSNDLFNHNYDFGGPFKKEILFKFNIPFCFDPASYNWCSFPAYNLRLDRVNGSN